jgi:hypothetical protein
MVDEEKIEKWILYARMIGVRKAAVIMQRQSRPSSL